MYINFLQNSCIVRIQFNHIHGKIVREMMSANAITLSLFAFIVVKHVIVKIMKTLKM